MKKKLFILVSFLTLIPLGILLWWMYCAIGSPSFSAAKGDFFSIFPSFLQNGRTLSHIKLVMILINLGILVYFITKNFKSAWSIILIVINSLLLMLNLWSLM